MVGFGMDSVRDGLGFGLRFQGSDRVQVTVTVRVKLGFGRLKLN
jgi:hypothetical protein